MNMKQIYKEYMRYGEILSCEDYDFTKWGGNFITIKIAKLDNNVHMFICVNGEVVKDERLNKYIAKGE